jgi:hypothetical protein
MWRRCLLSIGIVVLAIVLGEVARREVWYRFRYGRPLLSTREYLESYPKIEKGMSFDEVRAAIGPPHEAWSNSDGSTSWRYYVPSSLSPLVDGCFGVEFDQDGRMTMDWIP